MMWTLAIPQRRIRLIKLSRAKSADEASLQLALKVIRALSLTNLHPVCYSRRICDRIALKGGEHIVLRTEKIKKELDLLPEEMLNEVEKFIRALKVHKKVVKKKTSLLSDLADNATDLDLPKDFAKQHDHYLYGLPKR